MQGKRRYVAMHHPFTAPLDEDLPRFDADPGQVRAKAYDMVVTGTSLVAAASVFIAGTYKARFLICSGLAKTMLRRSLASYWMPWSLAPLLMAALRSGWIASLCCWAAANPSAMSSPFPRPKRLRTR